MPSYREPWAPEEWQKAREAFARGDYGPKRLQIVIISDSSVFSSTEKIEEVLGSPVEAKWARKSTWEEDEEDTTRPKDVMYCEVDAEQKWQLRKHGGTQLAVLLWVDGKRRGGWLVGPLRADSED